MSRPVHDLDRLVPWLRERVDWALRAVELRGHSPLVWETWRSEERARELKPRGGLSMHCYGAAVDVICAQHYWHCPNLPDCDFYRCWGAAAEVVGLTWGGRWRMRDLPHVQAVPVRLQGRLRRAVAAGEPAGEVLAGLVG